MNRLTMAGAAVIFALAGMTGAEAGFVDSIPNAATAGDVSAAEANRSILLVSDNQHHPYRHRRHQAYAPRPVNPGESYGYGGYGGSGWYGDGSYGYGYTPQTDWTTRCMEDLGYGRRGMYGCGR